MAKETKKDADYTPKAAKHDERCALCKHFQRLYDSCTKVSGEISPAGWCKYFERK